MTDRATLSEHFDRLSTQLRVARHFLLEEGSRDRLMDAREILRAVSRDVGEIIDGSIDPVLGWRPGHAVCMYPSRTA